MSFILDTFLFFLLSFHLEHEEEYIRCRTDTCQWFQHFRKGGGGGGGGGGGVCITPIRETAYELHLNSQSSHYLSWSTSHSINQLHHQRALNQPHHQQALHQPTTPPPSTQSTSHTAKHSINQPYHQQTPTPPTNTQSTSRSLKPAPQPSSRNWAVGQGAYQTLTQWAITL